MKKLIMIILIVLLSFMTACTTEEKGADGMYAEIYDRSGNHLSNVIIEKWNIQKRVFEFDTSTFEGTCDDDISEGIIFIFKTDTGEEKYSGFVKNITVDGKKVTFKGDDFRTIFNTQVRIDYTQEDYVDQPEDTFSIDNIFNDVTSEVANQSSITIDEWIIPQDGTLTQFIANYSGQQITVNAWQFLKVYLAYYNYLIEVKTTETHKEELVIEFVKQTGTHELRLEDFVFDKTTTEVKITNTVAHIKPADNLSEFGSKAWMYSSQELFDATPAALQYTYQFGFIAYPETWGPVNFEDSFEDFEQDKNIKVELWDGTVGTSNLVRVFYMQPMIDYNAIPTDLVSIQYFLGKDNQVYYNTIPAAQEIIPAITKHFESEYLSGAQYQAVWELVNSRYIEYIILTDVTKIPLDIKEFELYEMVTVYDSEGTVKTIPVSEITWTESTYKVKLGFKKTLFTEIVKGGS